MTFLWPSCPLSLTLVTLSWGGLPDSFWEQEGGGRIWRAGESVVVRWAWRVQAREGRNAGTAWRDLEGPSGMRLSGSEGSIKVTKGL